MLLLFCCLGTAVEVNKLDVNTTLAVVTSLADTEAAVTDVSGSESTR